MKARLLIILSVLFSLVVFVTSASGQASPSAGKRQEKKEVRIREILTSCEARKAALQKRSESLTNLVTKMATKFDGIVKRVANHYSAKVVPGGKLVSNYDVLLSDIDAKKTVVQSALATAQKDAAKLTCTGVDSKSTAKAAFVQFRKDMQSVKSALRDYRTSIKNLIVAVKSVTGETQKEKKP